MSAEGRKGRKRKSEKRKDQKDKNKKKVNTRRIRERKLKYEKEELEKTRVMTTTTKISLCMNTALCKSASHQHFITLRRFNKGHLAILRAVGMQPVRARIMHSTLRVASLPTNKSLLYFITNWMYFVC